MQNTPGKQNETNSNDWLLTWPIIESRLRLIQYPKKNIDAFFNSFSQHKEIPNDIIILIINFTNLTNQNEEKIHFTTVNQYMALRDIIVSQLLSDSIKKHFRDMYATFQGHQFNIQKLSQLLTNQYDILKRDNAESFLQREQRNLENFLKSMKMQGKSVNPAIIQQEFSRLDSIRLDSNILSKEESEAMEKVSSFYGMLTKEEAYAIGQITLFFANGNTEENIVTAIDKIQNEIIKDMFPPKSKPVPQKKNANNEFSSDATNIDIETNKHDKTQKGQTDENLSVNQYNGQGLVIHSICRDWNHTQQTSETENIYDYSYFMDSDDSDDSDEEDSFYTNIPKLTLNHGN